MITKQRLEELIKEKAKVYFIYNKSIAKIKELDLSDFKPIYFTSSNIKNSFVAIKSTSLTIDRNDFENIFETEEDARWELEMTAARTETLKLPTFEKLPKELDIPFIRYDEELESFVLYELYTYNNEICVLFREIYDDASDCLFREPLTKENYIEACKLCLRLFRGEEV